MTTLYARSDLAEVLTPRGRAYKVTKKGDTHIIDADPADVADLLATGSLVERAYDVPQTFDEKLDAEEAKEDAARAMQYAGLGMGELIREGQKAKAAATATAKPRGRRGLSAG